jgi:hypothetical protein
MSKVKKRLIGSNNGNSYAFINLHVTRSLTNSSYNSWLGILGVIALSGLSVLALTSSILYGPLFQKHIKKCKRKKRK